MKELILVKEKSLNKNSYLNKMSNNNYFDLITNELTEYKNYRPKYTNLKEIERRKVENHIDLDLVYDIGSFFYKHLKIKNITEIEEIFTLDNEIKKNFIKNCPVSKLSLSNDTKEKLKNIRYESVGKVIRFFDNKKEFEEAAETFAKTLTVDELFKYVNSELETNFKTKYMIPRVNSDFTKILEGGKIKKERVILVSGFLAVKFPDNTDIDNIMQEVLIGFQVNIIRKIIPNFVWTYGIIHCKPTRELLTYFKNKEYLCYVSEKIEGISLWKFSIGKTFQELFLIFVQVWFALAYANKEIGLTHYDLHAGNVIITKTHQPIKITYPWGTIKTNYLAKIIDWGRSFAYDQKKRPIGRVIHSQNVYKKPNYFYDSFFILVKGTPQKERDNTEAKQFFNFFGIDITDSIYKDIRKLVQKTYNFEKWINLILNCPSGKKYITQEKLKDVKLKDEKPIEIEKKILKEDYTFNELKDFLEEELRPELMIKQKNIEEKRIKDLEETRKFLIEEGNLQNKLIIQDLNKKPESFQQTFIEKRKKIYEISKLSILQKDLDAIIEIFKRRLDFLVRLASIKRVKIY